MVARGFLYATALVFVLFGLWGFIDPQAMVTRFGIDLQTGESVTLIRASYGGFLLGAAALFAYCGRMQERHRFGLVAVLLLTIPIFVTRLIGLLLDGGDASMHLTYLVIEAVGIILAAVLLRRLHPKLPQD